MTASATEERPIGDWMQVLEQIEISVERRLALVGERAGPPSDPPPAATTPLQVLDFRLAQMQEQLEQAEQDVRAADDVLRTPEEAYKRWTETMAVARRVLADWAACVGQGDKGTRGQGDKGN